MFSLTSKKTYQSPHTKVAEVDLEGVLCESLVISSYIDEIHNINAMTPEDDGYQAEGFYYEL